MPTITNKQQEILDAIQSHIRKTGQSPSIREIAEAVNLRSSCSVQKQVEALERAGLICRNSGKCRSITVIGDAPSRTDDSFNLPIPILGFAAGGDPIEAIQDIDPELLSIPISLLPRVNGIRQQDCCFEKNFLDVPLFAVQVKGNSMIDVGINHGDLVIARTQKSAENGEIVVALVEDIGATVKKYYRENKQVRLQPENEAYEPIYCENVRILGKVALAIKRF